MPWVKAELGGGMEVSIISLHPPSVPAFLPTYPAARLTSPGTEGGIPFFLL